MALTSGREEFAVAFVGKDEVSAMITELQAKLKGLEGQARAAGNAGASAAGAGGIKGLGESLKSATSGATSLGGGLAGIRMGMMGIPAAIAGIGAAVGGLVAAINDAFSVNHVKEFHDAFARDFASLEKSAAALIAKLNGTKDALRSLSTQELETAGKLQDMLADSDLATRQLKEQYQALPGFARAMADWTGVQRDHEQELHKIAVKRTRLSEEQLRLSMALTTDMIRQNVAAAVALDASVTRAAAFDPLGLAPKGGEKAKPRGGGGAKSESDKLRAALLSGDQAAIDKAFANDAKGSTRLGELAEMGRGGFGAEDIEEANKLAKLELEALKRADATWEELSLIWSNEEGRAARRKPIDDIAALSTALAGLRDIIPEVAIPFETLALSFSAAAEAGATLTEATLSSVGPTLKAFGAVAKGKREGFFLDGLGELAEAAKAFATPGMQWSGVGHLGAAAGFFYAAGKSGGKGGARGTGPTGGAGPRGGAAANDNEGAPKTVVYNISAGVMDGQSVQRAIVRAESSARGTGWEERRGW